MRLLPIITAILVTAFLYLFMFERDWLLSFAGSDTIEAAAEPVAEVEASAEEADTESKVSVVALKSVAQQVDSAVLLRGQTEAVRQVEVKAETSGIVASDPLRRGARVAKGDLLCEIDIGTRQAALIEAEARMPEAEARLAEARARLTEAEINANAATRLGEGGFASETRIAGAEAALSAARAGVNSAEAALKAAQSGIEATRKDIERTKLTAPFAGLLESDAAETGSLLTPGELCATIIQLNPIKLVGFVPETEVARVSVGAMAGARLTTGTEVAGRVTFLSRSADPTTRTFRVEVEVPNSDQTINDGQTAEIVIASEGALAHLLPSSALTLNDDGQLGLRIVQDGKATFIQVEVLRDTVDGIWLAGLPDTAEVIVVGQEYVTDGVPVAVTYREVDQ